MSADHIQIHGRTNPELLQTGSISPQYHVIYDEQFTIKFMAVLRLSYSTNGEAFL
jgi:hypothetical protein